MKRHTAVIVKQYTSCNINLTSFQCIECRLKQSQDLKDPNHIGRTSCTSTIRALSFGCDTSLKQVEQNLFR